MVAFLVLSPQTALCEALKLLLVQMLPIGSEHKITVSPESASCFITSDCICDICDFCDNLFWQRHSRLQAHVSLLILLFSFSCPAAGTNKLSFRI